MSYQRPTQLHEKANTEAMIIFAEHLKQFRAHCQELHHVEQNLATLGNTAFKAAMESSGQAVQIDNGDQWRHCVDLMKNVSVCHRRAAADFEFAIVERLPLKSGETKNVLMDSNSDVRELLRTFTRDQRQVLNLWKDDLKEQVREHLAENYPQTDMSIVVESFEIKMSRDIARRETVAQNHSRGMRI